MHNWFPVMVPFVFGDSKLGLFAHSGQMRSWSGSGCIIVVAKLLGTALCTELKRVVLGVLVFRGAVFESEGEVVTRLEERVGRVIARSGFLSGLGLASTHLTLLDVARVKRLHQRLRFKLLALPTAALLLLILRLAEKRLHI